MLIPELLILVLLAIISMQDIKIRLVYWAWFPMLAIGFFRIHWLRVGNPSLIWLPTISNVCVIAGMLMGVTVYVWITRKKFINIIDNIVGWADILFLLSISFYFSAPDFIIFCVISIFVSIIVWTVWQAFAKHKTKHIPLVGLQSITLILFLLADWWLHLFNLADDTWLLSLVDKWN